MQKEVGDDFAYFANDWEDIVASAKNRYGADDVERVLAHLGFDKNGKRRISFSGT